MNNQFDALTKSLAQTATRRAALKKFSVGLAGMALACFGLANKATAAAGGKNCIPSGAACSPIHQRGRRETCSKCCSGRYGNCDFFDLCYCQ